MKNHWFYYFTGNVTVKVIGKGLERFINTLIKNGIYVWNVKSHGTQALTFQMKLQDIKKLRYVVRSSECKITFLKRTGMPFLLTKMIKNSGFVFGGFIFLAVLFILSNIIWGIEIDGADPATEHKIRKELEKNGIKKGNFQFFADNPEAIQRSISNAIDEITWVGVELKGTTYHLQVVEKNVPDEPEKLSPQHLVAKKKAVIVEMFVEEGQAQVDVYDHVEPGEILVSGKIGKEGEETLVPARGKVYGETWYKSQVVLPLKSTFHLFNGNQHKKHYLKFGNISVPIWGFGKVQFKEYEKETNEKHFQFLNWQLPVAYSQNVYRERVKETREYTREQAYDVAREMARKDIEKHLTEDASIKGEKVLHQAIQNGKLYLTIHFQVVENIVDTQPIIQGESE